MFTHKTFVFVNNNTTLALMYLYLGLYETRFLLLTYSIENLSSTRKLD